MFPLHVYQNRRDRLKEMMPENSLAVISAAHESIRNRDAEYPFRQSSDFWYLTGFTEPDAVLIIGPGHPDRLFVRPKNPDQEVWTGRRLGPDHVNTGLGIDEGYPIDDLDAEFTTLLADITSIEYPFYCNDSAGIVDRVMKAKESNQGNRIACHIVLTCPDFSTKRGCSSQKKRLMLCGRRGEFQP